MGDVTVSQLQAATADHPLARVEDAIAAIGRGEIVIVVDDPRRENEGDFVMAADRITPEAINFMVTHGRGLVCLPMTGERLDHLGLRQMVPDSKTTAFTVSIDLVHPVNTGISALDRARCIKRAIAVDGKREEFHSPGHVFPLRARDGGVLRRAGHTEAAVDLARLAGCSPAGVICEIMNEDGTMARLPELVEVAKKHGLHLISIEDLITYRLNQEHLVDRVAEARIPTAVGPFRAVGYESALDGEHHIALVYGDVTGHHDVLVRVHSECMTGDVFGSLRCDCGEQLQQAMRMIAGEGRGVVVYLQGHEGRGIGIKHKLRAYTLQDDGADTVEANLELGFPADLRDYGMGAQILDDLGIQSVRLLTNNPAKVKGLERYGVTVTARVPIETSPNAENLRYLETKRDKLDHELALERLGMGMA
ncbi:MAG: bifunctional 3,4-dihydroxy-2-butanone-4-phosphate synthase/GTP cyclohydrolase II [Actinomycetota bacterium]|nr:bifunctional 3,4-dihydroxy-2-butanone-4-phosphate synthase/GTP cyclohydrolase II [Actinomycetota bacterium]